MDYNREKIFELGKGFDTGLVSFSALDDSQLYALSRYYALKNEQLDDQIQEVTDSLCAIDAHLDNVYKSLKEIK